MKRKQAAPREAFRKHRFDSKPIIRLQPPSDAQEDTVKIELNSLSADRHANSDDAIFKPPPPTPTNENENEKEKEKGNEDELGKSLLRAAEDAADGHCAEDPIDEQKSTQEEVLKYSTFVLYSTVVMCLRCHSQTANLNTVAIPF